jgi:hypothetical protein
MEVEKIDNLLAEGVIFKNQSADVSFAVIVHDQIALARYFGIGMYVSENAQFASDGLDNVTSGA